LFSAPLMVIALVLLMITVIGIPIALLLPIVYIVAIWMGQIAATTVLGARLMRRTLEPGRTFAPLLAGSLLVAVFIVIGTVLAGLGRVLAGRGGPSGLVVLFSRPRGGRPALGPPAIGPGAVTPSGFGTRPRDPGGAPPPPAFERGPAPPPAPAAPIQTSA